MKEPVAGRRMRTGSLVLLCAVLAITAIFALTAFSSGEGADVPDTSTSPRPGLDSNPAREHGLINPDDAKFVIASEIPGPMPEPAYGGLRRLTGLGAETGTAYFFGRTGESTPEPEMISPEEAQQIASDCVDERDGDLNLIPVAAEYVGPHAEGSPGEYLVRYSRVIGGVRCLSDGITVTVHPVNGSIMHYYKLWAMPEDQVPTDARPSVSESEAGARVKGFMAENGAKGVLVLSSELQWVDMNYPAGPEDPHDIRLAWRVRFIDDYYRSHGVPFPATMWIDAETGKILRYAYHLD